MYSMYTYCFHLHVICKRGNDPNRMGSTCMCNFPFSCRFEACFADNAHALFTTGLEALVLVSTVSSEVAASP